MGRSNPSPYLVSESRCVGALHRPRVGGSKTGKLSSQTSRIRKNPIGLPNGSFGLFIPDTFKVLWPHASLSGMSPSFAS